MKDLKKVRQVFLDMDGTIYHGGTLFPTTIPFLEFLKRHGVGYAFLSNNSSYSKSDYVAKLTRIGIPCVPDDFYISTDYTVDYLKHFHPELKRLYIMGMKSVIPDFEAAGFVFDDRDPQAVVITFDRELTYEKLCRAAWFMRHDLPTFATHPDVVCPTDQPTWLVDCGAMTKALEVATNKRVKVLGKPDPGLIVEAARRRGLTPENVMMTGDRLATDIALGVNAGAVTCHITGTGNDLIVPEGIVPDFAVRNLGELQAIWEKAL